MLQPTSSNIPSSIDSQLLALDAEEVAMEIATTRATIKGTYTIGQAGFTEDNAENLAAESDSDSSYISSDSIMRNADFVSFN